MQLASKTDEVRLTARAESVFGNKDKAHRWLHEPNPALDWKKPIQLASSQQELEQVEAILTRIEFGVLS